MSTHVSDPQLVTTLHSLATAMAAGVSLQKLVADPIVARTMPPAFVRPISAALADGKTLGEAFDATRLFRRHELAILRASEAIGRTDEGLATLAEGVTQRIEAKRELMRSLAYPAVLLVCAALILPLPTVVTAGVGAYLSTAIWGPLMMAAAAFVFLFWLPRLPPTDPRRTAPRRFGRALPFLRSAMVSADNAMFARVLGRSIAAGLSMRVALEAAADAVDDAGMRAAARTAVARIEAGDRLADALDVTRRFDTSLVGMVAQGELSGTLDTTLARYAELQADAARRAFKRVLVGTIGVVYAAVLCFIAFKIISGFAGFFETMDAALDIEV